MAITVNFWSTFSKRKNSTAQPPAQADQSFSCVLKSDSGILNPTLEISLPMSSSPAALTYAQMPSYNRYYWVTDWQWSGGLWLCSLAVDPLASYKTEIGSATRYVLRAASAWDKTIVDTLYPTKAIRQLDVVDTVSFSFDQDLSSSGYVLGVAARDTDAAGAITYYTLTAQQISDLVSYMLISPTDLWTTSFTDWTDILYRSIYSPFDYIKSCKWFPLISFPLTSVSLKFGNYTSSVQGQVLDLDATNWITMMRTLSMPTGWSTLEGKYKSKPYASLYIVFNPFGVIEIDPAEVSDASALSLTIYPDYISGDCMLKISKVTSSGTIFLTQTTARIGIDINLSASSVDLGGMLRGGAAVGAALAGALTGGASLAATVGLAAGGAADFAQASAPTMSNSVGITMGYARAMEGSATLIYSHADFVSPAPAEFGFPLYDDHQIGTLSGYIKCGDGDIQIAGFEDERIAISEYMTGGFYYE